jgi:phosphoglycolate phosphatase
MHAFSLKDFDLLLFDLDGTLVDSVPDITLAMDATLLARNWPTVGMEHVRNWVGNGSRKLLERAMQFTVPGFDMTQTAYQALHETVHDEFLLQYAIYNGPNTTVFPGVIAFLDRCQQQGKKLACVTNKPETLARQLLAHLGMDTYFSIITGGDTFPQRKPDPTALLYCCDRLQIAISRTLMIGDSDTDVQSARAANMPVVCLRYGYNHGADIEDSKPDWLVDNLCELPD